MGNNHIVKSPGQFDDTIYSEHYKIIISKKEAHSANCQVAHGRLLLQKGFSNPEKLIDDERFETIEIEVPGLRKGGGSLICLSIIFYAKIEALIESLLERRVIKKDEL
jgi:N-dimethylarginine dimethylaminohydrolase